MSQEPLIAEHTYDTSPAQIWKAITDRNEMEKWYFKLAEFKPEMGFEFQFLEGPPDKKYLHICKVTEVIPEKKLCYSWRFEGFPGNSELTFELFPEGDKTKLKLTHAGLETFGESNDPNLAVSSFREGWNHLLEKSLVGWVSHISM